MFPVKNICCGIICLYYVQFAGAQDNKTDIRKKFSIRGQIGASSNFYSSNETVYTRPSFAWNVNGSFVAKINQVDLPFSFVVNQYTKSNSAAHIQFGMSPTYKWAKLYLGYRYLNLSPLTFGGQTFKGLGLELNPGQFRFAAFYGRLNKAFNEDTSAGRSRAPQYSRRGYGFKIGIGNSSRFLDVIYFHAKDDSGSATNIKRSIGAQENAVFGSSFKLTLLKKITWTGDIAIGGLIQDLSSNRSNLDSSNKGLRRFMNNFLPDNVGTLAAYAGQSSLSYYSTKFNSNLSFRRVQPNFKSLGTPYLLNDIELITLGSNFSIVKRKLNISTSLSHQHNNLDNSLPVELQTQVGNININALLTQRFSLNLNFSGYNLRQKNGNSEVPDSLRLSDTVLLKQRVSQFNINPSYYIPKENKIHFIAGNISLQRLKDKNPTTAARTNSNNLSASAMYTLSLIKQAVSFSLNYLYSRYKQESNSYNSNGVSLGTSAQLLKNKNLNISGNFGYYSNKFSNTGTQKNYSYSGNVGYNLKRHSFSLFANYVHSQANNLIRDAVEKTFPHAVATKNLAGGISYNYSIY
jgi:hypothetical protein